MIVGRARVHQEKLCQRLRLSSGYRVHRQAGPLGLRDVLWEMGVAKLYGDFEKICILNILCVKLNNSIPVCLQVKTDLRAT